MHHIEMGRKKGIGKVGVINVRRASEEETRLSPLRREMPGTTGLDKAFKIEVEFIKWNINHFKKLKITFQLQLAFNIILVSGVQNSGKVNHFKVNNSVAFSPSTAFSQFENVFTPRKDTPPPPGGQSLPCSLSAPGSRQSAFCLCGFTCA